MTKKANGIIRFFWILIHLFIYNKGNKIEEGIER
ncbi:hypothetical protein QFZ87_002338 [Bacillus sp. SLBN-46]|jgi:hypothetical protein|nr:hypothetical protein [Bacillus sp. SLBN-46]